jgi:hypothetical protein
MADENAVYAEVVAYLKAHGHSQEEIDQILQRVRQYEERIGLDLVMQSIAEGRFDLSALIDEAMKKTDR